MRPVIGTTLIFPLAALARFGGFHWWGGAPECARSCMSSLYDDTEYWPYPTKFCDGDEPDAESLSSCFSSACSATSDFWSSYSSATSMVCAHRDDCGDDHPWAIRTLTVYSGDWGESWRTKDGLDSIYTISGCLGPGPWWGGYDKDDDGWSHWRTWTTKVSATVTETVLGSVTTVTHDGVATLAAAASGDVTATATLGVVESATDPTETAESNAVRGAPHGLGAKYAIVAALCLSVFASL